MALCIITYLKTEVDCSTSENLTSCPPQAERDWHEKVWETKWKGSKARNIGGGFKLFYHGVDGKRNGVGVILKEEYSKSVVEVKRVSNRVMIVKVEVEGMMINVISAYAPLVGCEMEEKERFWNELDQVVDGVPRKERLVIGADFNGHVGEGKRGDEEVMGRRCNLKEIGDCKVLAGDSVARQHRMVVCRMVLEAKKKRRRVRTERRIRWWKLKEEECSVRFTEEVRQGLVGGEEVLDDWAATAGVMREAARKVLGVTSGNRKQDKETWWWNEEVQESIRGKRLAKQKWDRQSDEKSRQEYKEMRQQVKRDVEKAKEKAYEELYERLDTKEKEKDLYRLARQRVRAGKDVLQDYDRVPREELWYCMRKSGVSEKYVRVVQDMYEDSVTAVKCAVGTTDWFRVKVGLHQGSALSPFLFALVMDRLTDEVRQESPWTMMFADDIVICGESRKQVKKSLERWRYALERRGMKVRNSKTEYMCVNEREGSGVMRLQGEEVEKVEEFRRGQMEVSKPPETTPQALVGKAYASAGQAPGCLHAMVVLQAYQADLLRELDVGDVSGGNSASTFLRDMLGKAIINYISNILISSPIAARIRFKTLMFAYKAKNGPAPSYLSDLITSHSAPRCLRSSSTARLVPSSLRMRDALHKYRSQITPATLLHPACTLFFTSNTLHYFTLLTPDSSQPAPYSHHKSQYNPQNIHGDSCLTSTVNLSITNANQKGLKANLEPVCRS
ncbi:hypothetical protein C0J45_1896 [Silurus meridionalis]|nr:hypothetical protein C0J45_1896 [Silurus meridionalis]